MNRLHGLLALLLTAISHQGALGISTVRKVKARSNRPSLRMAESFDSVTMVHPNQKANEKKAHQVGDYFVWNNQLWEYNDQEKIPIDVFGTSRGSCFVLQVAHNPAGHCSWTMTMTHTEEEEDEEPQVSKLVVTGDVDDLSWSQTQTLAIVGGTGRYEGVGGSIDVTSESGFFLYEIYTDS